ncbi:MAG: hypothetical protein R3C60_12475 [Parvularculaceae bacterium]
MFGGPNPYFEENCGPNAWDYYYEPIGPSLNELEALVKKGAVWTLSTASELARLYRWERKSWFMNPFGYYHSVENCADGEYPHKWWCDEREKARVFLKDGTVRFSPAILEQVQKFVDKDFSEETLGLQLRGSDKFDFGSGANLGEKVLPEKYFPYIDKYLAEHPKCQRIFVATDQRQWLKILEQAYPGKILSFSQWSLSDSDQNNFHATQQKAARGSEVIIDMLLLSRCSYIIKCHAAVGEMALVVSPDLKFIDLNYEDQPFEARGGLTRVLFAPMIKIICWLWGRLSENGLALAKVVSIEEDHIMVEGAPPRALNVKEGAQGRAPRPPVISKRFVSDAFRSSLQALADRCFTYVRRDHAPNQSNAVALGGLVND